MVFVDFEPANSYSSETVPSDTGVLSVIGFSGSGKTTLVEYLIRYFRDQGHSVAAIKHTHHPLETRQRGDTARFAKAGASEVMLANDRSAVRWRGPEVTRFDFVKAEELLRQVYADVVVIEGFKSAPLGQAILIEPTGSSQRLIPHPSNVVFVIRDVLSNEELRELTAILDRIIAR